MAAAAPNLGPGLEPEMKCCLCWARLDHALVEGTRSGRECQVGKLHNGEEAWGRSVKGGGRETKGDLQCAASEECRGDYANSLPLPVPSSPFTFYFSFGPDPDPAYLWDAATNCPEARTTADSKQSGASGQGKGSGVGRQVVERQAESLEAVCTSHCFPCHGRDELKTTSQ